MRIFRVIAVSSIIILVFSTVAFAQTENAQIDVSNKVGFIDSRLFYNEDNGIRELVEISDQLRAEFRAEYIELNLLAEKWINLGEELGKMYPPGEDYKAGKFPLYDSKLEEYKKLLKQYNDKAEDLTNRYKTRKNETEYSTKARISRAIRRFTEAKGYTAIVDLNEINDSAFTTIFEGASDITREFIDYYNFGQNKEQ